MNGLTTVVQAAASHATDSADPWSSAATVIAGLSLVLTLLVGLSNRHTARRALTLSEAQEARLQPKLVVRLNEPVSWRLSSGDRVLGFNLMVSNPTDRPSSIEAAELHLSYAVDGIMTTVKLVHGSSPISPQVSSPVTPIEIPARIEHNGAVSGWFLFLVPADLTGGQPVDRYDIVIRDIHGVVESRQVVFFREVNL